VAKKWTKKACFAHYGAVSANVYSWSARSADGKTVVVTLWRDLIDYKAKPVTYGTIVRGDVSIWKERPGNRERLENLKWAREHCGGRFRVVITVAKNVTASTREIEECYPQDQMIMRITELNEETGEFKAELVAT